MEPQFLLFTCLIRRHTSCSATERGAVSTVPVPQNSCTGTRLSTSSVTVLVSCKISSLTARDPQRQVQMCYHISQSLPHAPAVQITQPQLYFTLRPLSPPEFKGLDLYLRKRKYNIQLFNSVHGVMNCNFKKNIVSLKNILFCIFLSVTRHFR